MDSFENLPEVPVPGIMAFEGYPPVGLAVDEGAGSVMISHGKKFDKSQTMKKGGRKCVWSNSVKPMNLNRGS